MQHREVRQVVDGRTVIDRQAPSPPLSLQRVCKGSVHGVQSGLGLCA